MATSSEMDMVVRADEAILGGSEAVATIAVRDLDAARAFYEGKLGFEPLNEDGQVATYMSGDTKVFVYVSQLAGTNKATAATWIVEDVEGAAKKIGAKGVAFEHYARPGMTRKGDVHVGGDGTTKSAWFKDPDGNILALVSM